MLDLQTFNIREGMALGLFLMGLLACASGLWTIMAREYQQTLRNISSQSDRLHARALTEVGVVPVLDASTKLVEAVNQLIRTAMGVGAFLCLIGVAMCAIAWWMIV
jgi:dihydrodipicolinate synthase/N-acetylneuraminate lyase